MRFDEINQRFQASELCCDEAASLLGMSVSTFFRWRRRDKEEGAQGLVDRRIGKQSARRVPVDEAMRVISLFKTSYFDFTVKHFHEKLAGHGITRSYTWTKNILQAAKVVRKAPRRGAHRRKRPRKPLPGMMLHQDGSRHEWVPGRFWDLIVSMDDATGVVYSAFFVDEEGTQSTFEALYQVISAQGLFCSLYVDRGSHYFTTPVAGGKVDKANPTQVGRALRQLGIDFIAAYSPEARGRSERMFGTLQNRLPQELRLAGITTMEAANRFLREHFLADLNARFAVKPEGSGTAFTPWIGQNLRDILCIQEERTVANDNTVNYKRKTLQIPEDKHRYHYVRATVTVHEYPDGSLALFHGPRRLADYDSTGTLSNEQARAAA
ncbi:MAG: ISNCY family transposase [Azonexus sp.]